VRARDDGEGRDRDDGRSTGRTVLEGIGAGIAATWAWTTAPLKRWWWSDKPLEDYALVHLPSIIGDTLVAVALADSVFFAMPDADAARARVALYLALTMAPLAVAAPLLVPLLDRGGNRRAISFGAGLGRAIACIYAAPRVDTLVLFPAAFAILVMTKIHGITKNGLTAAYAPEDQGLMRANAWLARVGIVGALIALPFGLAVITTVGATPLMYVAAAVYLVSALMNARLDQPPEPKVEPSAAELAGRGRVPGLTTAAAGTAAARAASGFLLFLVAFVLRRADEPAYWAVVLMGAAMLGGFLGNVLAPRLPVAAREETVVLLALVAAGGGALAAFFFFSLPTLAIFAVVAGAASEFGRLSFQSLMQRVAPAGAHGRVFVRYEVAFQLSWVAGAFIPAMIAVPFRGGVLALAVFYLLLGLTYLFRPDLPGRLKNLRPGIGSKREPEPEQGPDDGR
jgi:hypothetical protein